MKKVLYSSRACLIKTIAKSENIRQSLRPFVSANVDLAADC